MKVTKIIHKYAVLSCVRILLLLLNLVYSIFGGI